SFHGWKNHQRRCGRHRQRARHRLLPRVRRGSRPFGRELPGILAHPMTRPFEQLWAETFRRAAERSPFYGELFRGVNRAPPLETVSLVDKKTLSERNLDFLCVPREQV